MKLGITQGSHKIRGLYPQVSYRRFVCVERLDKSVIRHGRKVVVRKKEEKARRDRVGG